MIHPSDRQTDRQMDGRTDGAKHICYMLSPAKIWKQVKFIRRYEKSEDSTKSPWYEWYEKSKDGTKSPWYETSTVRKVYSTKSLVPC